MVYIKTQHLGEDFMYLKVKIALIQKRFSYLKKDKPNYFFELEIVQL